MLPDVVGEEKIFSNDSWWGEKQCRIKERVKKIQLTIRKRRQQKLEDNRCELASLKTSKSRGNVQRAGGNNRIDKENDLNSRNNNGSNQEQRAIIFCRQ